MPSWTILGGGYQSYLKGHYQDAYDEWLPLAELGDAEAQYNLGVLFDQGAGRPRNLATAADWYRKAAGQGFVDAQINLGIMYLNGQGVERDTSEAARWFALAAAQGDAEAAGYLRQLEAEHASPA